MSTAFKVSDLAVQQNRRYARACAEGLAAIRRQRPRIQCITNTAAMDFTSEVLLAVGARPSLTLGLEEIQEFVASANSLSVNIGTLDASRRAAIRPAIETALDYQKPWVLDPVSVYASEQRCNYARELMELRPSVIRGNSAEIRALAGTDEPDAAWKLAQRTGAVVAQTGQADIVTDGRRALMVANGSEMQTHVSGMGCAETALVAAFLAIDHDAFDATMQALLAMAVAGEIAAERAAGPGSLHMHMLDTLYSLNASALEMHSHIVACEDASMVRLGQGEKQMQW
ncbi:hydroxyethylthiazole kinase [Marinobacterium arenosum]|uniref:hydroxyethylthiazole kinase n=1 Tax=Marinobacterium arenosum TaxID=2862496 RepID=UPI001C98478E|nr:hydroxyethylthiazole kinase [Marinobacterium arenosum]MBY4675183.1 hydroxyethylthiazole kinase [Marinobacterium arenosum]